MTGDLFIQYLTSDPRFFWAVCLTVVFSVTVHELSHGVAAIALGDHTPIERGHMTPNPLVHMGWTSLIMLLFAGIAWGAMPVDYRRLRGKYAPAIVAIAGPASNVILTVLSLGWLGLWMRRDPTLDLHGSIPYLLWIFGLVNMTLAIFNVLPIPPLDGSRVLANFSPGYARTMVSMQKGGSAGMIFLLVFLFAGNLIMPAAEKVSTHLVQLMAGY